MYILTSGPKNIQTPRPHTARKAPAGAAPKSERSPPALGPRLAFAKTLHKRAPPPRADDATKKMCSTDEFDNRKRYCSDRLKIFRAALVPISPVAGGWVFIPQPCVCVGSF